ncbi:MAG: hypothetical protein IT273_07850 [Chitinophagales bacterium]|nr:hypothetical protein [Chitinophagales bacterium]
MELSIGEILECLRPTFGSDYNKGGVMDNLCLAYFWANVLSDFGFLWQ